MNTVWQALVEYKNSPEYMHRVVAAYALRAILKPSKWSAL